MHNLFSIFRLGFIAAAMIIPLQTGLAMAETCTGAYPSYWQDPNPKFTEMWAGQTISNVPPANQRGRAFRLSDDYPTVFRNEIKEQPWRSPKFDPLFDPNTDQKTKTELAWAYSWEVMRYIQAGNISSGNVNTDWTLCNNNVRGWYHIPYQTYETLSGREYIHGLTREAPVTFNVKDPDFPKASLTLATTMWAVGFFNPTAAYTLGTVWKKDGRPVIPVNGVNFKEGAVVGKLLFNTSTSVQLAPLTNMPVWQANISDPSFCKCNPTGSAKQCTMVEESQQCARSSTAWNPVRLLQFDIAIKDNRASGTKWVFGTFVADGQRKANEPNPWNRITPLGLMWGNDTPPKGELAYNFPKDPRANGFMEEVIFWDTVKMLNAAGGTTNLAQRPGHLGCNNRLNGPADNANSSCMSCHQTASVADENLSTPPIVAQFGGLTDQCVTPDASNPLKGVDRSGASAKVINGITFSEMDSLYFANTDAGASVNMTVQTPKGPKNVLGNKPVYPNGSKEWISLDFSLQLSISLTQWGQWQKHQKSQKHSATRVHGALLPAR